MKTQIIKIIPCLLAGFILSACVGAVNVPSSVAEKTTESDPVIKKTVVVIIDDKEPEPVTKKTAVVIIDDKEPEPQEVVEIPNPCLTNPFGDTCTENFATERESITMKCINDVTGDLCHQAITQVCLNTFSPRLCNKIPTYLDEFKACGYELDSESCAPTITRACHDFENNFGSDFGDAFNLLCEESVEPETKEVVESKPTPPNPCIANPFGNTCGTVFNTARESVCAGELNSDRCAPTIIRVCERDSYYGVLDDLCVGMSTYYPEQERLCALSWGSSEKCNPTFDRVCGADIFNALCKRHERSFSAQKMACADEINSERCLSTILRICRNDIFNPYCYGAKVFYYDQERACLSEPNSSRCEPTILRVCTEDSLDTLCTGLTAYFLAQRTACAGDNSDSRCDKIIAPICSETPFDTFCQSKNLTLHELPVRPREGRFESIDGNTPIGHCGAGAGCF